MYKQFTIAATAFMLVACGEENKESQANIDYDKLQTTPQSETPLILAKDKQLLDQISNGLRLQLKQGYSSRDVIIANDGVSSSTKPAVESANKGGFSGTNTHVNGVDEADTVKYDGHHWFIATQPEYEPYLIEQTKPAIRIMATDPAVPSATHVADYEFADNLGEAGELYLVSQNEQTTHVAALRNQWGNVRPMLPGVFTRMVNSVVDLPATSELNDVASGLVAKPGLWLGPQNSKVYIDVVDVATPSNPSKAWSLEVDGSLINSRKVGNTLYLVTRFDPWISDLKYEYGDLTVRTDNEETLANLSVDKLMPHYRMGNLDAPLSTDCYMQEVVQKGYGLSTLIHITAIDLSKQKIMGSSCINSNVESMSMSTSSVYLTGSYYGDGAERTVIHKFSLANTSPKYSATGYVNGFLGWNSDPVFRMHEQGDQFRIVTSSWVDGEPKHLLSILSPKGGALETLATLPNKNRPEPIGKKGEDIHSVRFEKSRAFVVTFQRTDPLYNIDLSNPVDPKVVGKLEIPGFATYMHPFGDYLFTLGNDADETGRVRGVKAELISVVDNQPKVVTSLILGGLGSYSSALDDLKAINILAVDQDQVRIAFPISAYKETALGNQWDYTGIQLLEINGLTSSAEMINAGSVKVRSNETTLVELFGNGRSVLHDDAVFVTWSNKVWAANWFAPEDTFGPVAGTPVFCTEEFRMGLSVDVRLDDLVDGMTACDANVIAYSQDNGNKEALQALGSKDPLMCTFVGAGEQAGSYYIDAWLGKLRAEAKTTVYRDQCHVIPEKIGLNLSMNQEELPCDSDAVDLKPIYLRLELRGVDGDLSACDSQVYANQNGKIYPLALSGVRGGGAPDSGSGGESGGGASVSSDQLKLVSPPPPNEYVCEYTGYDLTGDMVIYVENANYQAYKTELSVSKGECRIEPQRLSVTLQQLVN